MRVDVSLNKKRKCNPQCQQCNEWKDSIWLITVDRSLQKRNIYICGKCSNKNSRSQAVETAKQTNLKKYGVSSPTKLEFVKLKTKQTNLKKYGVESPSQSFEVKQKKELTCIKKYGVSNVFKLEKIKNKIKNTKIVKSGNSYFNNSKKRKDTVKARYGVENIKQLDHIKKKAQTTFERNWGSRKKELYDRISNTKISRYGKLEHAKLSLLAKNNCKTYLEFCHKVRQYIEETQLPCNSKQAEEYFKCDGTTLITALRFINRDDLVKDIIKTSSKERELLSFIQSIFKREIKLNDRNIITPQEIDIYIPELSLAFEFNGNYFHSEKFQKDKFSHYNKYKNCLDKGVALYTIFEGEWDTKKEKIKKFIKNLIIPKSRVFARKCEITYDIKALKKFIKDNHIQGLAKSHYYIGLVWEGAIVMALSIGNHHRKGKKVQVLNRVCFSEFHVIGGLKKLLKHVPKPLITWSDNRFSPLGTMYKNAGFTLEEELPPDYMYTYGGFLYSKQSQKKELVKCPKNLKEHEWALERGLIRIWDCGKKRWVIT